MPAIPPQDEPVIAARRTTVHIPLPQGSEALAPAAVDALMTKARDFMSSPAAQHWVQSTDGLSRISVSPWVNHGKPTIDGTRVPVYILLSYLLEGLSNGDLLVDYPDLKEPDISEAIQYAINLLGG